MVLANEINRLKAFFTSTEICKCWTFKMKELEFLIRLN